MDGGPFLRRPERTCTKSTGAWLIRVSTFVWFALGLASCVPWHGVPHQQIRPAGVPGIRVVEVEDLGVIPNPAGTRGRDGGYSAILDGRAVWIFGDTILDDDDLELEMLSNSWSWTSDVDASDGISGFQERRDADGRPTELLPFTAAEASFNAAHRGRGCATPPCQTRWALWPGSIVPDPVRGRALVFYVRIYAEPGPYSFRPMGCSIAVWPGFDARPLRPVVMLQEPERTLLFPPEQPCFGAAAVVVDEMLYAYACDLEQQRKSCRLGRVPLDHALQRSAWRFFVGGEKWGDKLSEAVAVFDGSTILSVFHVGFANRFLALYSRPFDSRVVLRTAARPEGPWSEELPLFDALVPNTGPPWIYDALSHPEYASDGGRVQYVTYSRATGPADFEFRLVRVELEVAQE